MRDEAVVPRIAHRRIEKAIHNQGASFLVHFVFDRLAADGQQKLAESQEQLTFVRKAREGRR